MFRSLVPSLTERAEPDVVDAGHVVVGLAERD